MVNFSDAYFSHAFLYIRRSYHVYLIYEYLGNICLYVSKNLLAASKIDLGSLLQQQDIPLMEADGEDIYADLPEEVEDEEDFVEEEEDYEDEEEEEPNQQPPAKKQKVDLS